MTALNPAAARSQQDQTKDLFEMMNSYAKPLQRTQQGGFKVQAADDVATKSGVKGSASQLAQNFDTFLKLFLAGLKNQDPTNPADTQDFTAKFATFAGVEQQVQANKHLSSLVEMSYGNGLMMAQGYCGKTITFESDLVALDTSNGTLKGPVNLGYTLPMGLQRAEVMVTDEQGRVAYREELDTNKAGDQVFAWDGRTNNGQLMPSGVYRIKIIGKDAHEQTVVAKTFSQGHVKGFERTDDNEIYLSMGNFSVPLRNARGGVLDQEGAVEGRDA